MAFWGRAAVIPLYVRVGPRQRNFLHQDQFCIARMQNRTHAAVGRRINKRKSMPLLSTKTEASQQSKKQIDASVRSKLDTS